MHWPDHLRETAAWLLTMANTPGWSDHAKHRRDALLANQAYGEDLRQELQRQRRATKEPTS